MSSTLILDIDGVLSTHNEFNRNTKKFQEKCPIANDLAIPYPFNGKCVDVLNEIICETDCEIVLSSDWRKYWSLEDIDKIFKFNNIFKSPFAYTDIDPVSISDYEMNRMHEIKKYIDENAISSYVIIDDLDLSLMFPNRFVRTNMSEGIKQLGVKNKILTILNKNE